MKTPKTSIILRLAHKVKGSTIPITARPKRRARSVISSVRFGVIFVLLAAAAFYTASSASSSKSRKQIAAGAGSTSQRSDRSNAGLRHNSRFITSGEFFTALMPLPPGDEAVATYEATGGVCSNVPKTNFAIGEQICAKVTDAPLRAVAPVRRVNLTGTRGFVRDTQDVTSDPQNIVFTLPSSNTTVIEGETVDNRGVWSVSLNSTSDSSTRAIAYFNVSDPLNAAADLVIYNFSTSDEPVLPGASTGFLLWLSNNGPNAADNVHVTQAIPPFMTFDGATTTSAFTCTVSMGVVDCTLPAMTPWASGAVATITLNYTISGGAENGVISSEADIDSDTSDPRPASDSSEAQVEVRAAGAPPATCSLGCPGNLVVTANTTQSGQDGAIVNFGGGVEVSGDCGSVTFDPTSGTFLAVGNHSVNVESSTGGGSCNFTVTVVDPDDSPAPTISCQPDQTATASGAGNEALVTVNGPTATGNNVVTTGTRSDNREVDDAYPVGTTTITWTAKEYECNDPEVCPTPNGRTASCTQRIIVTSADAPTISCPTNKTFNAASGCETTLTAGQIGTPTTTGINVTVTARRSDNEALTDPFPAGQTTITWTATECTDSPTCDENTNRSVSCTQIITITSSGGDTTPPTLNVPADVSATTSSCSATLDDELGVATADDNCSSSVNISRSGVPMFSCPIPGDPGRQCESFVFPTGTTVITYTATDAAGNTAVGTQNVVVTESPAMPPTITAPGAVTVNADAGSCSASGVALGSATTADNCGVASVSNDAPAAFPVGDTTVTWTVTDRSGNQATATQLVTVVDNQNPVLTPPADVTAQTGPGATSCDTVVSDAVIGSATAIDNCPGLGAISRTGVPAGNLFPVGETIITYSVTDNAGHTVTATQKVTVEDNTLPVVTPPANVTAYTGVGATSCDTVVSDAVLGSATATDNCPGIGAISRTGVPAGNVFPVGTTTISYSVTDAHGNVGTATQTVTVIDNTVPVITTNGTTPSMWPANHSYRTFNVTDFLTSVSDNCSTLGVSDVVISQVTSDETENGNGDGNTDDDIVIAANCKSVQLRAERQGSSNGRVYTITFKVKDSAGNVGTNTSKVVVPKSPSSTPVDSGPNYTVTGCTP